MRAGCAQLLAVIRQAAHDEDEAGGAEFGRLVDGGAIAVEPAGLGEEPAPA